LRHRLSLDGEFSEARRAESCASVAEI
jgi:hypothetical protein